MCNLPPLFYYAIIGIFGFAMIVESKWWWNGVSDYKRVSRFRAGKYLDSIEACAEYLRAAQETGDEALIRDAMGLIIKKLNDEAKRPTDQTA